MTSTARSSGTGRRRTGDTSGASDRRRQVIEQAAALFDRSGYHTANMTELARAVGLEKPTLYHYFSGKDEILFWIHEEFIDLLIAKAEARAGTELAASSELRLVIGDLLELMDTHRGHVRVFFEHARELTPKHERLIRSKRDHYQALVQSVVERGIHAGEFRPLNPRLVTLAVFGACNWSYQWYRQGGALASADIAEFFWDLLVNGMRLTD